MIDENTKKSYLKRIKSWILKSNKTKNKFDKYLALFIAFNIFYSLYARTKDENADLYADKKNACSVKELLNITKTNIKLAKDFYGFISKPNNNFSLKNRRKEDLIDKLNKKLIAYENHDIPQSQLFDTILECLYTVRSNLVHGAKDIIQKQRTLMSYSTNLLKPLLEMAIKNYKKKYIVNLRNTPKKSVT